MYLNYETEEYSKYYTHPISVSQLRDCESKNIKRLLLGSIVNLTLNELLDVLSRQNLLNINTLSIQKSGEQFWCVVDKLTSDYWHEQKRKMPGTGEIPRSRYFKITADPARKPRSFSCSFDPG